MRHALVPNPPWVNSILAKSYDAILHGLGDHPEWMPQFQDVQPIAGSNMVTAELREYGCGVYGCVFPTLDPRVVLKVTTDDTEAEFARDLSTSLVKPICVHYYSVMELDDVRHQGRQVYLLWRESAQHVGKVGEYARPLHPVTIRANDQIRPVNMAVQLVTIQWDAAQAVLGELRGYDFQRERLRKLLGRWLETCEAMARQTVVPDLRFLGEGLVEVYTQQRIFFGDIHTGNLGQVPRLMPVPGYEPAMYPRWVITDPGNIYVIEDL